MTSKLNTAENSSRNTIHRERRNPVLTAQEKRNLMRRLDEQQQQQRPEK